MICPFCSKEIPDGATVCPKCLRAQPMVPVPARGSKARASEPASTPWSRILVLLVVLAAGGAYAFREYRPKEAPVREEAYVAPPPTVAPPLELAIADSAKVRIDARRYLAFAFSGGDRSTCRVQGEVRGLSGDGLVNVFIVDADGLATLERGGTPRTYYESGPLPSVSLHLNVDGRTQYTLIVANARSSRAKTVRLDHVRASCSD
jgi:hypothetical protein